MDNGKAFLKLLHLTILSVSIAAFVFGAVTFYKFFATRELAIGFLSLASWLIGVFSAVLEFATRKLFETEEERRRSVSKAKKKAPKARPAHAKTVRNQLRKTRKAKRFPIHKHVVAMVAAIEKRGEDIDIEVDVENVSRSGLLVKSNHHFSHNVIVTLAGKRLGGSVVRELYSGTGQTYYYGIKYQDEIDNDFVKRLVT